VVDENNELFGGDRHAGIGKFPETGSSGSGFRCTTNSSMPKRNGSPWKILPNGAAALMTAGIWRNFFKFPPKQAGARRVQRQRIVFLFAPKGFNTPSFRAFLKGIKPLSATTSGEQHTSPFRARLLIQPGKGRNAKGFLLQYSLWTKTLLIRRRNLPVPAGRDRQCGLYGQHPDFLDIQFG
jgi:hypothetical protein